MALFAESDGDTLSVTRQQLAVTKDTQRGDARLARENTRPASAAERSHTSDESLGGRCAFEKTGQDP